MKVNIYKDYETLSAEAAAEIIQLIQTKPDAVLCLAAGNTPVLTYQFMVLTVMMENIDLSHCTFVGLDEWIGIPPDNEGSCQFMLRQHIFRPLNIAEGQIHLFNALSEDPEKECSAMDDLIASKGNLDLMLVGVGQNGHIGFNEPGVPLSKFSHVTNLDDATQAIGQKYFNQPTALKKGITLGLGHLIRSRKVIMMANGVKKAAVIRKALEENISNQVPASIIRDHPQGLVMLDKEAASLLINPESI